MFDNKIFIFSLFILIIFSLSAVSASNDMHNGDLSEISYSAVDASYSLNNENADDISSPSSSLSISNENNELSVMDDGSSMNMSSDESLDDLDDLSSISKNPSLTKINAKNIKTYYKECSNLDLYLKDKNNVGISNKTIKISIGGKTYTKLTDLSGKVSLSLNGLKPNHYLGKIEFSGDDDYSYSSASVKIDVRKTPLAIKVKDFKTYFLSDFFFKAKVINNITKNPVAGVNVLFNVYSSQNKFKNYYARTDKNGIASLKRNLNVGCYDVYTYIKDNENKDFISYRNIKNKVSLTVKKTAEMGCSSIYVRKNENESAIAFRRDSTYAATLYIVAQKWHGRTAIKQYKLTGTYFFHAITTSDGWLIGTGGWDNPTINKKIENLAGQMVSSNSIQSSKLNTIKRYQRILTIGHFAIVAPNGRYAVVWKSGYIRGKLKNGEYLDVPNARSLFRHGKYKNFSPYVASAAMRIAATDRFGVNRRNIMTYHYKRVTKNYKTSAQVSVYGTNDKGNLMGRHTASKRDHVYYKKTYFSKYKLPGSPSKKLLGTHKFGNIDKLIKTQTTISAPKVTNDYNASKYFKVTLKNKKTKNLLKGVKINLKVYTGSNYKNYVITTNKSGIARFNTKVLNPGTHSVVISPANHKYIISGKGTIVIREPKKNSSNSSIVNNSSSVGDNSTDVGNSSVADNSTVVDNSSFVGDNSSVTGNSSVADNSSVAGNSTDAGNSSDVGNATELNNNSTNETANINSTELENFTEDTNKNKTNLSSIKGNFLSNLLISYPNKVLID